MHQCEVVRFTSSFHATALLLLISGCAEIGTPGDLGLADPMPDDPKLPGDTPPVEQAPPAPLPCEGGDAQVVGSAGDCYLLVGAPATYAAARAQCQGIGFDLARVRDDAENALVHTLIASVEIEGLDEVWLGGNDAVTEGVWVWNDDPQAFAFALWDLDGDEPDDAFDGQDCMAIELDNQDQTWTDRGCDLEFASICQRPPPAPPAGG